MTKHGDLDCYRDRGFCRICDLIDRDGPHYREDYRRRFHPEEFVEGDRERAEAGRRRAEADEATARADAPDQPAPHAPPLAGDLVASLTAALGVDKAAGWIAKQLTGVPNCGCESRKLKLNALDARARRLLARLAGRRPRDGAATAGPAADMDPPAFGRAEGGFIARRALREFGEGIADDD